MDTTGQTGQTGQTEQDAGKNIIPMPEAVAERMKKKDKE